MHRVLATLVAAALLIGCSDPKAEQRAAYLASGEAHAAADADYHTPYALAASKAAIKAADAVGTDRFYPAVREADAAAEYAWERAQENAKGLQEHAGDGSRILLAWAAALEASRKAWEAAERAMASHD